MSEGGTCEGWCFRAQGHDGYGRFGIRRRRAQDRGPARGLALPRTSKEQDLHSQSWGNCQSQLPSSLQQKAHGQQQRVAPLTASLELPLLTSKDQIQRLQERDPDPPFSLPELKPKECPCPASQPHFETEQDVFLIKDTWEAFALCSFPGLSLILTVNLQKGSPMLLTILQCQHIHVAVCPARSLSVPHKCSAPLPSISFLRRNGLALSLPH